MKKKFCFLLEGLLGVCLIGCAAAGSSASETGSEVPFLTTESSVAGTEQISPVDTIPLSELKADKALVEAAAADIPNWTVAEDLVISVPEGLESLSDFTLKYASRQSNKDFYEDFVAAFEYLFPDHTLGEEYLRYYGENSRPVMSAEGELLEDLHLVRDYYDEIMADEEDVLYFFYNENGELFAEFTSPIGNDLSNFNKGEAAKRTGRTFRLLEVFDAGNYFETLGEYSPDSEDSFKLLDGEMSIKDAVRLFEEYIANIPGGEDAKMKLKVINVSVLDLLNGCYGYRFETTASYNGILFDYFPLGVSYQDSGMRKFISGDGVMVKTDDVDSVYGIYRMMETKDEEAYTEIIPIDTAIDLVYNSLTSNVEFTLKRVEVVYSVEENLDGIEVDEYLLPTKTAWKLTLVNENDSRAYICYVNARDGQDFYYFTTDVE